MPDGYTRDNIKLLDAFDEPVRAYLESEIKRWGHDPAKLRPVIHVALNEGKKIVGEVQEAQILDNPKLCRSMLEQQAFTYILGVMRQSKKWESASELIKSYSSVFVTGAGISFESDVPLVNILDPLIKFCGATSWVDLRDDPAKCFRFKTKFKEICDRKKPGISHNLIVYHFPKYILEIICLNWDDLFERAAITLGKDVHKINEDKPDSHERNLWKFHSDIECIRKDNIRGKGGWVFPDESGYVFDCFLKYIKETGLSDNFFILVIVGYGEMDEEIYEKIIKSFELSPPRPSVRIGLDLSKLNEEEYIVGPSDYVLPKILPPIAS